MPVPIWFFPMKVEIIFIRIKKSQMHGSDISQKNHQMQKKRDAWLQENLHPLQYCTHQSRASGERSHRVHHLFPLMQHQVDHMRKVRGKMHR